MNVAHQTAAGRLVWRSLGMLRAVRGLIAVSLVLGVVASALPYVSAAAFGPMMQVVADAVAALVAQGLGSDHGDFDLAAADAFAETAGRSQNPTSTRSGRSLGES